MAQVRRASALHDQGWSCKLSIRNAANRGPWRNALPKWLRAWLA